MSENSDLLLDITHEKSEKEIETKAVKQRISLRIHAIASYITSYYHTTVIKYLSSANKQKLMLII